MRIAVVHDWLVGNAGGERVLSLILDIYPNAELFSLVDFLTEEDRKAILKGRSVTTSFIQHLPFAKRHFRNYLGLFPAAVRGFDLEGYDLIISSSWAFAKGIRKPESATHICYCHTPIRYAWDLKDEYVNGLGLLKRAAAEALLFYIRRWDRKSSSGVDFFVANSRFVRSRIRRIYSRDARVIYPPVDVNRFRPGGNRDNYYITVSRLVPYKRVDLIIEAFNRLKRRLLIVGDGPEMERLKSLAGDNIEFLGFKSPQSLVDLLRGARAFVFAAVEDFGIAPVEAMACGTPVIGYARGGLCETVINGINGILFEKRDPDSIAKAVLNFELNEDKFDETLIRKGAERFSPERFRREFTLFVNEVLNRSLHN